MEISQRKINKLIAIQNLVQKGDEAVLEKILEFQDVLEDVIEKYNEETNRVKGIVPSILDELKAHVDDYVNSTNTNFEDRLNNLVNFLENFENTIEFKINDKEASNKKQIETVFANIKKLNSDIVSVRQSIPKEVDLSSYNEKVAEIESKITELQKPKAEIQPIEIRNKLESISVEEEKLSIEAISFLRKELDELKRKGAVTPTVLGSLNIDLLNNGIGVGATNRINFGTGLTVTNTSYGLTVNATGGGSSTDTWYQDEVLTRTDGTTYTLAHTPTSVLFLFLNGQKITEDTDFTVTGDTITMTAPTLSSDVLTATYAVGTSVWYEETVARTDGTNYTLAHSVTSVLFLYLNGQLIVKDVDYALSGANITMTSPTLSTDTLTAKYQ